MNWSIDIHTEGFNDPVPMEWRTVRSWSSFTSLFKDAERIEGVTYCESPELLLELLESSDYACSSIELLVGDRDDYRSDIDDISVARRLQDHYRDGNLIVYLKNRKIDHSKLFRIVMPDGSVTLIAGSANLSYNSWKNQTNSLVVYKTTKESTFDRRFSEWIRDHWEQYGHKVFLEDLVEKLDSFEDEEKREQFLQLWVQNRTDTLSDRGVLHTEITAELEEMGRNVVHTVDTVKGASGDADEDIKVGQSEEEVTIDVSGVDTDGAVTSANVADIEMKLSTQSFDESGYLGEFKRHIRRRGAKSSSDALAIPVETYTNYLEEQYDQWRLWIDEEQRSVHFQIGEEHRILTARQEPTPGEVDMALENVGAYLETVERWGETNQPEAVMAHMYEGILFGLWAPFINLYARGFHGKTALDKSLPYLFIFGNSDAGKDQFTQFVLRLLSDDLVDGGSDGDDFTKTRARVLREIDTVFPFVVSDIKKQKIEAADPLRNFWRDSWNPDLGIDYPAIIFTSNDSRPNEWFRNRAKMLHFDVVFPSNPNDDGFHEAQRDLNDILDVKNRLFAYVSREMLLSKPYENPTNTIDDVRAIVRDLYELAGRETPTYFPASRPAEVKYDIGKRKWRNAYHRGDVSFDRLADVDGHIIANFELDSYEVYEFNKIVPKQIRPEKRGNKIVIRNSGEFVEWFGEDPTTSGRLLQRLFLRT